MNFKQKYGEYLAAFEAALRSYCAGLDVLPPVLADGMRYSLLSGGKRIRPVLFFGAVELFGGKFREETGLALALECIHTYSLIHDDLPALDNDDFRRGNPSNHKVYGEANAILAGDALLSEGASIAIAESARSGAHRRAAHYLLDAAGPRGMLAGQSADLLYAEKGAGEEELSFLYTHKTGKLIAAPIVMAAILTGADEKGAERFGFDLGDLFQLTDDILDEKGSPEKMGKTLHKDREEGKLTCVKVFGMRGAELRADLTAAKCREDLAALGCKGGFLDALVTHIRERDN